MEAAHCAANFEHFGNIFDRTSLSNFSALLSNFSTLLSNFSALFHHARAVCHALLGNHAYRMLTKLALVIRWCARSTAPGLPQTPVSYAELTSQCMPPYVNIGFNGLPVERLDALAEPRGISQGWQRSFVVLLGAATSTLSWAHCQPTRAVVCPLLAVRAYWCYQSGGMTNARLRVYDCDCAVTVL